ncbi:MAG: VWA domain-containing protein [Acidobacteria bacterium]|nr:VWA domain-containing protein [Acidobacteriota bacterium]
MKTSFKLFIFLYLLTLAANIVCAQSRHNARAGDTEGTVLTVTATRSDGKTDPIRPENLFLYENGVEQRIRNFSLDPSPSRIVLLVDNSQTLPTDLERLKAAALEFAYEIFDGDQLFVIAYDEKPEIIQEWTDSADKMSQSFTTFRKKGNPHLFDAINSALKEILIPLMPGTRKTAIVVIGDGLDRGSVSSFDQVLADLQFYNVTVYSLQLPDRTGGAYRRNMPKPGSVISQLTEGTGGLAFPFENSQEAAKAICDELRSNRYLLSYLPLNTSTYNAKRVFLMADEGISIRTKAFQPPNIK